MSNATLKILHLLHFLTMLFLLGIGFYYLTEYRPTRLQSWGEIDRPSLYIRASYEYGILSCIVFSLTTVLGILTIKKMPKTASLLVLGSGAFAIWSGVMANSPRHISINEIFPAWVVWIIIAIVLNRIVYLRVNSIPEVFFDNDDILDN